MADVKADAKPVPTPPNDVPGIRADLDALKATVAALAVRVAAIEASAVKDDKARSALAAVLADLCSTMCGFLTQPVPVMTAMGELERRAKACRL